MRIAQLIDNLYSGGAQRMLSMLTYEFSRRQIETLVVSLDRINADAHYAEQIRSNGTEVMSITGNGLLDPGRIKGLVSLLRQRKFDLIHVHLSYANMLGVLAGRLAGLPVVATLHSTGIDRRLYNPIRYQLETLALRSARCNLVAVGHAVVDAQQSRVGRKKIKVIPNAMSILPDLPPQDRKNLRLSLTNRENGAILISVGRLILDKGYSDMLIAFNKVLHSYPDVLLLIAGDGNLMNTLQEQARTLGIDKQVFFLGKRDDIPSLLMASDMYISASHREGMSMSLLESMAASLPTITTDVGDAARMFTKSTGVLVKPHAPDQLAEAISTLLADPARMKSMGEAAREHLKTQYGLEAWTNEYLKLYRQILETQ